MTISWNAESELGTTAPIMGPFVQQLALPLEGEGASNTYSPGTIYQLDKDRYALTLDQDETTVTYLVINKGQSVTKTHEEFNAGIRTVEGET